MAMRADNTMPLPTIFTPVVEARRCGDGWAVSTELPGMRCKKTFVPARLVLRCRDRAHAHHPDDATKAGASGADLNPCPLIVAAAHLQRLCERQATRAPAGRPNPFRSPPRSLRQ